MPRFVNKTIIFTLLACQPALFCNAGQKQARLVLKNWLSYYLHSEIEAVKELTHPNDVQKIDSFSPFPGRELDLRNLKFSIDSVVVFSDDEYTFIVVAGYQNENTSLTFTVMNTPHGYRVKIYNP